MTDKVNEAPASAEHTWAVITDPRCGHSWRITKAMIRAKTHLQCPACNGKEGDKAQD